MKLTEEQTKEIAKAFYYIMYGEGILIPRIAIKIRLQILFEDNETFEKENIDIQDDSR